MSTTKTRRAVTARRWEHGWELYDGAEILTQSATLADAAGQVRDYLATEFGGEPEDYDVDVSADLGGVETEVAEATRRVASAQAEAVAAGERWRKLASVLRDQCGLSVRDTAFVMGISAGRVSQLEHGRR